MEEKFYMEQQRTNELLETIIKSYKDQNDLLTINQVHKEYGIGLNTVRKMFNDTELPVQRYTVPFIVTRQAFLDYLNKNHDYLSERK